MKEKKTSADWYIAATYWLTTIVLSTILGALIIFVLAIVSQNPSATMIGFIILDPLVMWLAVRYSVKFLDKTYIIRNANQIVMLSTI